MLNFLFGRTFWSTVVRSALFLPVLSAVAFPVALVFRSDEEIAALQKTSVFLWAVQFLFASIFGAWVGWGVAYWRFEERPIGKGLFAIFPLLTGLGVGPLMFWALIESLPPSEQVEASERMAAMIFGAVAMPLMALLMCAFWRYALNWTALKPDKH